MFYPNYLYKHVNNTDVAFEVIKKFYIRETQTYKLRVGWWNVVPSHPPYPMRVFQAIEIPRSKAHDWVQGEMP